MKLSFKTILQLILISALLILLAGCFGVTPDVSPGYTPGTITGIIAAPCCSTSAGAVSEPQGVSPEYWCYYCQETWKLQDGIEVILTYGEEEKDTVFTNEVGEFTFTNVEPGKNYVITAYCPDFDDNRPLVKDVALELVEGGSFDTKITDLVSTSLGLVVDFLVTYTELTPEDIVLDDVIANKPNFYSFPRFKKLIIEVQRVLEDCGNVDADEDVQDALCEAAEEVGRIVIPDLELGCGPGYTPPPPGPCAGNVAPSISSVLLDSTVVIINQTVHVIVGTPYVITVNATDDGTKDPLTYYASVDGVESAATTSNQVTVTPTIPGTFEVYAFVHDGCVEKQWGPVTIIVDPVTYTVTYDANDGTGSQTDASSPYYSGETVTVLGQGSIARTNYTFIEWNTAANGSGTAYDPTDTFTMPAANVTLFAQWTEDTKYTVTYDANDGTGSQTDASSPYYSGETVTVLGQGSIARTNYTFIEWNTAANGSGTAYDPTDTFTMPAANVTLFAQWTEDTKYTVTYDANDGTGSQTDASSPYYSGETVTVLGQGSIARTNYTFIEWNTAANGSGTAYDPTDTFTMPAANVTLFAQWTEDTKYTVTYDANDGTGSQTDASSPYYSGETVTVLGQGSIARTNYTFIEWNTAANGSGTAYDPTDTFTMPAANVTLFAQWTEDTKYTVTYDANDGTGSQTDASSPYYSGETVTVLGQGSIARDKYNFDGWNTAANGSGTAYDPTDTFTMPAANVTLYAQWVKLDPLMSPIDVVPGQEQIRINLRDVNNNMVPNLDNINDWYVELSVANSDATILSVQYGGPVIGPWDFQIRVVNIPTGTLLRNVTIIYTGYGYDLILHEAY